MKHRALRIVAAALALLFAWGMALAEVRTTASVNVRSGPGLSYDIVATYQENKSLTYLGESSTDDRGVVWYKVSTNNGDGWVSSRYSELKGEAAPTAEPVVAEPTAEPAPAATEKPADGLAGLPALNAGGLFAESIVNENPAPAEEPAQAPVEVPAEAPVEEPQLPQPGQTVELSTYYRSDLVTAANEIGMISYRQVESEAPYQYYDAALILAGNQNVENIVVYGGGYEVYGVHVGMNVNEAMAFLNAAGLDYMASPNGVSYEHRAAADAPFADENGHDSCINLWVDADDVVTEIDWSTYTG